MAIDLEFPELPDTLSCDGGEVRVRTSFRLWLRFGRLAKDEGLIWPGVLDGEPVEGWEAAAEEFYASPVATPAPSKAKGPRAMDLGLDGDYVVGSFMQAYGIDLTSCDMHWHLFLALLRSLPDDTKLMRIAGYRTWDEAGSRRKPEEAARELRRRWALPEGEADADLVALQKGWFGEVRG